MRPLNNSTAANVWHFVYFVYFVVSTPTRPYQNWFDHDGARGYRHRGTSVRALAGHQALAPIAQMDRAAVSYTLDSCFIQGGGSLLWGCLFFIFELSIFFRLCT